MKKLENMNEKERKAAYIKTAENLQKVCGFEPKIVTKGKSVKELEAILQEAKEEVTPDDKLIKLAKDVLAQLPEVEKAEAPTEEKSEGKAKGKGKKEKKATPPKKEKAPPKKEKEEVPAKEEKKDKKKGKKNKKLKKEIEATKKMTPLKQIVKDHEEFKSVRPKLSGYSSVKSLQKVLLGVLDGSLVIKETKEPASKGKSEKKKGKKVSMQEKIDFYTPLIKEGKFTQKQLTEKGEKKFPVLTTSTIRTFLTDQKNEKYCRFPKIVVVSKEGNLKFGKKK